MEHYREVSAEKAMASRSPTNEPDTSDSRLARTGGREDLSNCNNPGLYCISLQSPTRQRLLFRGWIHETRPTKSVRRCILRRFRCPNSIMRSLVLLRTTISPFIVPRRRLTYFLQHGEPPAPLLGAAERRNPCRRQSRSSCILCPDFNTQAVTGTDTEASAAGRSSFSEDDATQTSGSLRPRERAIEEVI